MSLRSSAYGGVSTDDGGGKKGDGGPKIGGPRRGTLYAGVM